MAAVLVFFLLWHYSFPFVCPIQSVLWPPPIGLEISKHHSRPQEGCKIRSYQIRPESLLTITSKVMESIIAVDVAFLLLKYSIISDHQVGF